MHNNQKSGTLSIRMGGTLSIRTSGTLSMRMSGTVCVRFSNEHSHFPKSYPYYFGLPGFSNLFAVIVCRYGYRTKAHSFFRLGVGAIGILKNNIKKVCLVEYPY